MRINRQYAHQGMTLIELMIVVTIVAILAAIAVPSYRGYVLRSNRAEATSTLLRVQVAQEKFVLNPPHAYTNDLALLGIGAVTERGLYTIQLENVDPARGYTARATAVGNQAADADCPAFTIDQAGQRQPDPAMSRCWQ